MSDLSTRARQLATKDGIVGLGTSRDRLAIAVDAINALSELAMGTDGKRGPIVLNRVLFDIAVLSSLFGQDIVDGVQSAIEQREISGKKPIPGTLAPVPNARANEGSLRDPSGKEAIDWES